MKKGIREFVRKLFLQKPPYKLIDLEIAMRTELPKGTPKGRVIAFVQTISPFLCDDRGKQVVVNLVMDTGDLVHVWEVVIIFDFDEEGRLRSYRKTEAEIVDYEMIALRKR